MLILVSEAQKKATTKYESKVYDKILVRVPKGKKDVLQNTCKLNGVSVNKLLNDFINEYIENNTNNDTYDIDNDMGNENINVHIGIDGDGAE